MFLGWAPDHLLLHSTCSAVFTIVCHCAHHSVHIIERVLTSLTVPGVITTTVIKVAQAAVPCESVHDTSRTDGMNKSCLPGCCKQKLAWRNWMYFCSHTVPLCPACILHILTKSYNFLLVMVILNMVYDCSCVCLFVKSNSEAHSWH